MRLYIPKPPSARNLKIYDEVHVARRTQEEVATQQGISQARVSQICRDVGEFYERNFCSGPGILEEAAVRSQRDYCARLERALDELWEVQRFNSALADESLKSARPTKKSMAGLVDYMKWSKELTAAEAELIKVGDVCEAKNRALRPWWGEDRMVTIVEDVIEHVRQVVREQRQGGYKTLDLPDETEHSRKQREMYARAEFRRAPGRHMYEYLPPEWRACVQQAFYQSGSLESARDEDNQQVQAWLEESLRLADSGATSHACVGEPGSNPHPHSTPTQTWDVAPQNSTHHPQDERLYSEVETSDIKAPGPSTTPSVNTCSDSPYNNQEARKSDNSTQLQPPYKNVNWEQVVAEERARQRAERGREERRRLLPKMVHIPLKK